MESEWTLSIWGRPKAPLVKGIMVKADQTSVWPVRAWVWYPASCSVSASAILLSHGPSILHVPDLLASLDTQPYNKPQTLVNLVMSYWGSSPLKWSLTGGINWRPSLYRHYLSSAFLNICALGIFLKTYWDFPNLSWLFPTHCSWSRSPRYGSDKPMDIGHLSSGPQGFRPFSQCCLLACV